MKPPSGYEHLPIMNKVKKWGNFLLSNLLEDIVESPNLPNSLDNFSNFPIGGGRDNESERYFENGSVSDIVSNSSESEVSIKSNSSDFVAPEGLIKKERKTLKNMQLSAKEIYWPEYTQSGKVGNFHESDFYSNIRSNNRAGFTENCEKYSYSPSSDYFLTDMSGNGNFATDANNFMESIPNDTNFMGCSDFQEDKSEFCTGMIMRDYNRSETTPPTIINSNNDQNSNMNNGFSGDDDTPNSNESRARPQRQAKTRVDYRQLHNKGRTTSGSATNTPRPKRVRNETQKVTLEKSAEVMTSGINPADVNLDLDVSSSPEMERNEDAGKRRNSITGLNIADGSFIEDNLFPENFSGNRNGGIRKNVVTRYHLNCDFCFDNTCEKCQQTLIQLRNRNSDGIKIRNCLMCNDDICLGCNGKTKGLRDGLPPRNDTEFYTLNTPQLSPSFQVNMIANTSTGQPSVSFSDTIVTIPSNTTKTNTTNSVATGANLTPVNTHVNLMRKNNSDGVSRSTLVGSNLLRNNATARNLQNPCPFGITNPPQPQPYFVAPPVNVQNTTLHSIPQNQQHQQASGSNQQTNPPHQNQQRVTPLPTPNQNDPWALMAAALQGISISQRQTAQAQSEMMQAMVTSNRVTNVDRLPNITGRETGYEIKNFFSRLETVTKGMNMEDVIDLLYTKLEGRASDKLKEAVNNYGSSDYFAVKNFLVDALCSTDIKRNNFLSQLMSGVTRKEKEGLMAFGYRIYDMTKTVFPDTPFMEQNAAQFFLKSLSDRELANQLAGHVSKNCTFEDILEKASIISNNKRWTTTSPQNSNQKENRMGNYGNNQGHNRGQNSGNFQNYNPNNFSDPRNFSQNQNGQYQEQQQNQQNGQAIQCWGCGQDGHKRPQCPNRQQNQQQSNYQQQQNLQPKPQQAFQNIGQWPPKNQNQQNFQKRTNMNFYQPQQQQSNQTMVTQPIQQDNAPKQRNYYQEEDDDQMHAPAGTYYTSQTIVQNTACPINAPDGDLSESIKAGWEVDKIPTLKFFRDLEKLGYCLMDTVTNKIVDFEQFIPLERKTLSRQPVVISSTCVSKSKVVTQSSKSTTPSKELETNQPATKSNSIKPPTNSQNGSRNHKKSSNKPSKRHRKALKSVSKQKLVIKNSYPSEKTNSTNNSNFGNSKEKDIIDLANEPSTLDQHKQATTHQPQPDYHQTLTTNTGIGINDWINGYFSCDSFTDIYRFTAYGTTPVHNTDFIRNAHLFSVSNKLLYFVGKEGRKLLCVPEPLGKLVISQAHNDILPGNFKELHEKLFYHFYWPNMKADIENFTKVRIDCLLDHASNDTMTSSQPIVTKYTALSYKHCNSTS